MTQFPPELTDADLRAISTSWPLPELMRYAVDLRDSVHGNVISYSRKVFIPLTRLCRNVCAYCTFVHPPKRASRGYLTPDEVLEIARQGAAAGCHEALFTLGDKPELRYRVARDELAELGHSSTIDYLAAMCERVFKEVGLLPHANPGVMTAMDIQRLRRVTVSLGTMLEGTAEHLGQRGGPHFGSPDKRPELRLETIRLAGEARVPFTSGILIGIGETRSERLDALLELRSLHRQFGHLQEIIIQNFRAKADTRMRAAPQPDLDELCWTIAMARIVMGGEMNIQAPPNLTSGDRTALVNAGINDWGGISPVTADHVNPEAPWPAIDCLERETARCGKVLLARLAAYPSYCLESDRWHDPQIQRAVRERIDSQGYVRDCSWRVGDPTTQFVRPRSRYSRIDPTIQLILAKAELGQGSSETEIARLFAARDAEFDAVVTTADRLRAATVGDTVRYVVNRNINYTNICSYRCSFCAFSKGRGAASLRGPGYRLEYSEVARRSREAWDRGATEVCMQGGIHPHYTGQTYIDLCKAVKDAVPDIHIHAFSPLEIAHGAQTLGIDVADFLRTLKFAGLGTLPGTAAEILDDEVRATLCPDKLSSHQWLDIISAAHRVGLHTTATIMFGHMETVTHWARHLAAVRRLQQISGGITEFVPLPFVSMEAPLYRRGGARPGPTSREATLMHAVARLALHPVITNIQVSWVKMGEQGVQAALSAGANDLGGTLMNESISRAAGADHGQEWGPERMEQVIRGCGRKPEQRTTTYRKPAPERIHASFNAAPLARI